MTAPENYFLRCTGCWAKNRIPSDRRNAAATCGRCKAPLDTAALNIATPLVVTDADFTQKILRSPLPVLLDCWAPWCGPCRSIAPVMTQLAAEWAGRMRVAKLNVDQNNATAETYHILSIPTLLIFDKGRLAKSLPGAHPKQSIIQAAAPFLSPPS